MPKSKVKPTKNLTIPQRILLFTVIFIAVQLIGKYLPHKKFPIPSPTLHFIPTEITKMPIEYIFCYDFGGPFVDGKFVGFHKTCTDPLMTNQSGIAHLPVTSITSPIFFGHIGNLSVRAVGIKDGEPCAYILVLLPDPWRSDASMDKTSFGFSEVDGKVVPLTCEGDLSIESAEIMRSVPTPPVR